MMFCIINIFIYIERDFSTLFDKVNICQEMSKHNFQILGNSHRKCSIKKVFLKMSQNSHENICVGVSFY